MMKKGLKLTAALVALVMVLCLAGCASGSSGTAGASADSQEAPRELSLCMSQTRWGGSVDDTHMKAYVEALEKATNTKIEMIAPTHTDFNEKLNVLMASGEYPDIIRPQQSWDYIGQFAVRGYLQPVTKWINEDERFAKLKETDLSIYQSGEDIYGIPTGMGNAKIIWVRQDMIDKYGLDIEETMTTDAFVEQMRKIDQSQTIPLVIPKWIVNFQIYYNFFGAYGGPIQDENGQWIDGIATQEMKDALLWLKGLYDEGIIDSEFITNENSNMREKFYTGQAACMVDYSTYYQNILTNSESVGAPTVGVPIYTLIGPNGDKGNLNESGGEAMALTKTCKNPEAAMDVIHYMFFQPEGELLNTVGVEGVHYTIENGELTPTEAAVTGGYTVNPVNLGSSFSPIDLTTLPYTFAGMKSENLNIANEIVSKALSADNLGPMVKIPMGTSQVYDENAATYNNNLYEMATKIVMGTADIEQVYADYAKFWQSINGDEMLKQLNEAK